MPAELLVPNATKADFNREGHRPYITLFEGFQDEVLGIDATKWTVTNPATGTAWTRAASGAYLQVSAVPNANEVARFVSVDRWILAPGSWGTNTIMRRLILEFEMKLANVANLDNTICFFGLTPSVADTRATAGIAGFALLADVLQSITDSGGAETTATAFGETLTNWNKLRIEAYAGAIRFYVNEVLKATHTANLPSTPMYLNFYADTEAGGAATLFLANGRAWTEDIKR